MNYTISIPLKYNLSFFSFVEIQNNALKVFFFETKQTISSFQSLIIMEESNLFEARIELIIYSFISSNQFPYSVSALHSITFLQECI